MRRAAAAAIGAAAGAWLLHPGPPPPASWPALVAGMLVALALLAGRRTELPFVAAVAALAIAARLAVAPGPSMAAAPLPPGSGPWLAVVEAVAAPRNGQQPATLRLVDGGLRVAATLPRFPGVEPGHRVVVDGAIRPPPDDGYGDYLRRTDVAGTLRAGTLTIEGTEGAAAVLESLRRAAAGALARAIPEPEAGLAAGILIGLRDRVDRALAADFTTAGASHVVAISGWNIAIVAASIGALGGRLARRRRSLLTSAAILAYVVFVGASPSVVRAAAMAGVVLLARESGRAGRAAAALGWAAALLLVADPNLVRDAGFQLSTLATGGLIAWATPLTDRLHRLGRGRLPGWLTEGLGVSLAAQAATLPVVLASFGRLSLVAPAVNLGVVPLVAPAMAAGAIALLAGLVAGVPGVPAAVASIGGLPAWALLGLIVGIVRAFAGLPLASVTLEPPAALAAATATAAAIALVGTRQGRALVARPFRRTRGAGGGSAVAKRAPKRSAPSLVRPAALALVAALGLAGLVVAHRPDGRTTLVVLDVGQGDAILIEGSRGGRMLVDGGPDPDRLLVALDERLPPWDRRLDALVLTHPHEDHVAGLALLLERYRVGRVLEPGMRGPGPGYAAWLRNLAATGIAVGRLSTGARLQVDEARMTVLWPDPGSVPLDPPDTGTAINNVSVVLLGEAEGRRFLLTGDIEEEIDPTLVTRGLPPVDVLKVAHHGSGTATTDAFLDAVRPRVAVVSAGADNRYGHPNPGTLERLAARGARTYRTDRDGTVEITLDDGRVTVRRAGAMARRTAAMRGAAGPAWACVVPALRRPAPPATASAPPRADLYHRADDRPRAHARRPPPPQPRPPALAPPPLAGSGGDRRLARRADRPRRHAGRPAARRVGGPPPRRRQGAAARRSRPPPAARRRLGGLARPPGPPGARSGGRGPPGHAPRRRRAVPTLGGLRQPRGADRGLRRQARGAAPRVDGRALRVVGAALPGRPRRLVGRDSGRGAWARRAARA
jgi:competence protein ComEC